jgi:hypothetical protein
MGTVPETHSSRQSAPRAHWGFAVSRASLRRIVTYRAVQGS